MTRPGRKPGDPAVPAPSADLRVALLAPRGRDSQLICDLLGRSDVVGTPVASVRELIELVGECHRAGAIILADEAVGNAEAEELAAFLEPQPAWSDLPVLLLVRQGVSASHLRARLARPGAHVLSRPLQPETFTAAVHSALEVRRRQYQVRDLLRDSRELNEQLERRADQLRRLSLQLGDAEERERRRLAVYVHDDLQQILAGIMFHLDVTERRLGDRDELLASLARVRGLVEDAIEGTRSLAQQLSPSALRRSGLVAGLNWLAGHVEKLHGLRVRVENSLPGEPEADAVVVFLFRSAQELLLNVTKHAKTNRASMELSRVPGGTRLIVADHGVGFHPSVHEHASDPGAFGLFSIRERAELLGGAVQVQTAPGAGTSVSIVVPDGEAAGLAAGAVADLRPFELGHPPGVQAPDRAPDAESVIRVVLADDHVVMRSGLRLALTEHARIRIIDECDDGLAAVEAAETARPDLILMDVAMPRMDGIAATREIKRLHPEVRVIGLSMFDDPETSERMIEAGAERYLSKAGPSEDLVAAILQGAS